MSAEDGDPGLRTELPVARAVHLAVEDGCGGTTFGLQLGRARLKQNEHVAWVCREMPDGARFSQLMEGVSPVGVSRLHLAATGDNIEQGILSAEALLDGLDSLSLIVIDDWAPQAGQVPAAIRSVTDRIIEKARSAEVDLLLISSTYASPEAGSGRRIRQQENLEAQGLDTWVLSRHPNRVSLRQLTRDGELSNWLITDGGFSPHHSS